jgi:two-component system, response regulator PdtaR
MPETIKATLKALRVLVVEDNALIGTLYADVLAGMGHSVCAIAGTEAEAVAEAAQCKPDLLIVDAVLTEGSGIAAVDEILRSGFIPHVFISGNAASVRAMRPGAIVLQKPFRNPELSNAIQRALTLVPQT